eukprot:SAG31_NODE_9381_length_1287_cov_1.683502_2_plen_65_part_00
MTTAVRVPVQLCTAVPVRREGWRGGRLLENGSLKYWYLVIKKYQGVGASTQEGARTKKVLVPRT